MFILPMRPPTKKLERSIAVMETQLMRFTPCISQHYENDKHVVARRFEDKQGPAQKVLKAKQTCWSDLAGSGRDEDDDGTI